jgi:predicted nucleic acid-binding protein
MNEVFADTSGWGNFFVRTEPFHLRSKNLMNQWHTKRFRIITTNYVLIELIALFTSPLRIPRVHQIKIIETIKTASWVEIIHINRALDDEAWTLLKEREDKNWSQVDCASFVVMRHRNIIEALTTDPHFEQAGFVRLLK